MTNLLIEKKIYCKKEIYKKKKKKTTPQHFCVAEDCMLLEGGVLYGFTVMVSLFSYLTYSVHKWNVKSNIKHVRSYHYGW